MKKVYICSPLGGDVTANLERARQYARYVFSCGAAPVVPHFYALVLDDGNPEERQLGMQAGKSLLWLCDELWIFGEHVSAGMREEIRFCQHLGLKIRTITEKQFASGKAPERVTSTQRNRFVRQTQESGSCMPKASAARHSSPF